MEDEPRVELSKSIRPPLSERAAEVTQRGQQVVREVVRLLAALVARLRTPLLLIALLPALPAVVLIGVAAGQGAGWVTFSLVCVVFGLAPSAWLLLRREQLGAALQPHAAAAEEIMAALAPTTIWEEVRANLETMRAQRRQINGLRQIWRGVRLGGQLKDRLTGIPRIRPFLPGRLRGLGVLVVVCLGSAAALTALVVLELLIGVVGLW